MPEKENAASAATPESEETVAVYNRGGGSFIHGPYRLDPGSFLEVPKSVADLWLGHGGAHARVVLAKDRGVSTPAPADPKLVSENAELKSAMALSDLRIKALEAQLEAAKAAGGEPPVPSVPPKSKASKSEKSA